ncbi:MAG: hypothetical protein B7733_20440 [Myxococcales bacterium FL481]|nr:MAG: hypothetical protein B7733_20440 [Myxococcales bacterium FL481]
MDYVDLPTAKTARGVRLVVLDGVPSPWSQAAKGLLQLGDIPFVCVRSSARRPEAWRWTGCDNAPVAVYDDEPPRTGWAEILALAQRLAPSHTFAPREATDRAWMWGLCHEMMSERGLVWCRRLDIVHRSLVETDTALPRAAAQYLGAKYGYRGADDMVHVRARMREQLELLASQLERRRSGDWTVFADGVTAVDIYLATALETFLPHAREDYSNVHPVVHRAYVDGDAALNRWLREQTPLVEHRDHVFAHVLKLPISL